MAICVDRIRNVKRGRSWHWDKSCHLFCDEGDIQELHAFAKLLKLKREWFQDRDGFPHYDLTEWKRTLAVRLGAKEVDRPVRREGNGA